MVKFPIKLISYKKNLLQNSNLSFKLNECKNKNDMDVRGEYGNLQQQIFKDIRRINMAVTAALKSAFNLKDMNEVQKVDSQSEVTPQQLFLLATHLFPQRGIAVGDWKVLLFTGADEYKNNLKIAAYINQETNQIVVVPHILLDKPRDSRQEQDILQYFTNFTQQLRRFADANKLSISYLGYRYGGGIAEAAALRDRVTAVTFDSLGFDLRSNFYADLALLTRYVSDPNATLYGNVYHVPHYAVGADEIALRQRFESALQQPNIPVYMQNRFQRTGWLECFDGQGQFKQCELLSPRKSLAGAVAEVHEKQASCGGATMFGWKPEAQRMSSPLNRNKLSTSVEDKETQAEFRPSGIRRTA